MKIGILTFHRAHNYGAVLQCYALQEVLKSLGHNVQVIDYRQPWVESVYKKISWKILLQKIKHPRLLKVYFKQMSQRSQKKVLFESFLKNNIKSTQQCEAESIPQDFDIYIIGSDQLWGMLCVSGRYGEGNEDRIYMGDFKRKPSSKVIAYALSSDENSINEINCDELIRYISNFDVLSFREEKISTLVYKKTGIQSRVDIDPTLLANRRTWDKLINDKWRDKKYLLFYEVRSSGALADKAKELAKKKSLEFLDFSKNTYGVDDFVSAIASAECVVTSSFHATVFSLIFERSFCSVILHDGHDERYVNLLNQLGAADALSEIDLKDPTTIHLNYKRVYTKLELFRKKSLDYIESL